MAEIDLEQIDNMDIVVLPSDKITKVPYGIDGKTKITIAQMIETKEFKSLEPTFARRVLKLIRDYPTFGILQGGADRPEPEVRDAFYANYTKMAKQQDYENMPDFYPKIKAGKIKWNPEDKKWYKMTGRGVYAVPGGSWHTGGYAVDFTGDFATAAKVSMKYGIKQILGTDEVHHFQPAGLPTSKRMFQYLRERYKLDPIKTPLPQELIDWIDSEVASNVPRHPTRILSQLDARIDEYKKSIAPKPIDILTSAFNRKKVEPYNFGVDPLPVQQPTTTTSSTTTVKPTTTTVKPTTTTLTPTTTSTLPDLPEPSNKETREARDTRLRADWVMDRSDALVATGMSQAKADKQALKDVTTQFGKQDASIVPTTTVAPTTTVLPTTTTTIPATTTTVPESTAGERSMAPSAAEYGPRRMQPQATSTTSTTVVPKTSSTSSTTTTTTTIPIATTSMAPKPKNETPTENTLPGETDDTAGIDFGSGNSFAGGIDPNYVPPTTASMKDPNSPYIYKTQDWQLLLSLPQDDVISIQRNLMKAFPGFKPGQIGNRYDPKTISKFKEALSRINQFSIDKTDAYGINIRGKATTDAVAALAKFPMSSSSDSSGGGANPTRVTSPTDLKAIFRKVSQDSLGRTIGEGDLNRMIEAYQSNELSYQRTYSAGGASTAAPDPTTFAQSQIEKDFGGEVNVNKLDSIFANFDKVLSGGQ
jgi:hypothetical protein